MSRNIGFAVSTGPRCGGSSSAVACNVLNTVHHRAASTSTRSDSVRLSPTLLCVFLSLYFLVMLFSPFRSLFISFIPSIRSFGLRIVPSFSPCLSLPHVKFKQGFPLPGY